MLMCYLMTLIRLLVIKGNADIDYQFSTYIGQIIYDQSGKENHAVNGETSSDNVYDTIPTDRGAYFSRISYSRIKLPSNEAQNNNFKLQNPSVIVFWVLAIESTTDNALFYRFKNDKTMSWSIKKLPDNMLTLTYTKSGSSSVYKSTTSMQNSNPYTDVWNFLAFEMNINTYTLYLNGNKVINLNPSGNSIFITYDEESFIHYSYIGYIDDTSFSFNGFFWSFQIFNALISLSNYYSGLHQPGNCLTSTCPSLCNPSIKKDGLDYCISVNLSPYTEGDKYCPLDCNFGCKNSICLECKCIYNKCILTSFGVNCVCPSFTTATSTTCVCDIGFYFDGSNCVKCNSGCKECINSLGCSKCIDSNAEVDRANGRCQCKPPYASTLQLLEDGICKDCSLECNSFSNGQCLSCSYDNSILNENCCECIDGYYKNNANGPVCYSCLPQCKKCIDGSSCVECLDPNSYISVKGLCECNDGFWSLVESDNDIFCLKCNSDCKKCLDAESCLECIALNSVPSTVSGVGCICKSGYYNTTNLNEEFACKKCNSDCETCDQDSICLSCLKSHSIPLEKGGCACEEDYYDSGTNCIMCADNCLACSDSNTCEKCISGYYLEFKLCYKCERLCKECSAISCLECSEYSEYIENTQSCGCILGFEELNNECIRSSFTASLAVLQNNSIVINFTKDLGVVLKEINLNVFIEDADFGFSLEKLSDNAYLILLSFFSSVKDNTEISISFIDVEIVGKNNETYVESLLQGRLYKKNYYVSYAMVESSINNTSVGVKVAISASITSAFISNPASTWVLISSIQLLSYIPLGNTEITSKIKELFSGLMSPNIFPNPFSGFIQLPQTLKAYPEAFHYGIETDSFIYNTGFLILNFFVILGVLPLIILISKIKIRFIQTKCDTLLHNYRYSVFLRYWIQSYLDLGIFAVINLRSVIDRWAIKHNWLDYLNLGVSCIVIVISI